MCIKKKENMNTDNSLLSNINDESDIPNTWGDNFINIYQLVTQSKTCNDDCLAGKSLGENEEEKHQLANDYVELRQNMVSILTTMFQENLNHARHAENERMSLAQVTTAMVPAILTLSSNANIGLQLILYSGTLFILWMSRKLSSRWNTTYDQHFEYATACHDLLQGIMFYTNDINNAVEVFRKYANNSNRMFSFKIREERIRAQSSIKHTKGKFIWLYNIMIFMVVCALLYSIATLVFPFLRIETYQTANLGQSLILYFILQIISRL